MELPEKPPDWRKMFLVHPPRFSQIYNPHLRELIWKSNENYEYWDVFRQWRMPQGFTPESAWAFLKWHRAGNSKFLPVLDRQGRKFTYFPTEKIMRDVQFIERSASKAAAELSVSAAERENFAVMSLMEEAIASSRLDGVAVRREQAKDMLESGRDPVGRPERAVLNNYLLMVEARRTKGVDMSIDLLLNMHHLLMHEAVEDSDLVGRFRNARETAGARLPLPPAEKIRVRLQRFCEFANSDDDQDYFHAVVKAAILHFWLQYENPFPAGNGRLARAVFYWYLFKRAVPAFEFVAISRAIADMREAHESAFAYAIYDDNDATYFIAADMAAVRAALDELRSYLERRTRDLQAAAQMLVKFPGINQRQQALIGSALGASAAVHTIGRHMKQSGVVYQTARTDLLGLVEKGLFHMVRRGKTFTFVPAEDLRARLEAARSG